MAFVFGPLTGDDHLNARPAGLVAPIAFVDHRRLDRYARVQLGLRQRPGQRVTVIRIARQGMGSENEGRTQAGDDTDLDAKLVALVCLALADAFGLRRMQAIELVAALRLLGQQSF